MSRQLELVYKLEKEKEDSLARFLKEAQSNLQQNQQKLSGLQQYRNEYMKNLHEQGTLGVSGKNYLQTQQFINKLEQACQQQHQVVATAKQVVDQRRQVWLQQQSRRKAVELLIEKEKQKLLHKQQVAEQKMMDELVLNRQARERAAEQDMV